jgi:hypothetical protein
MFGPAFLRSAGASSGLLISDWTRLRCAICGGAVYADEVRTVRQYPPVSWDDFDRPRRGGPPNWLLAERRAAPEETEDR